MKKTIKVVQGDRVYKAVKGGLTVNIFLKNNEKNQIDVFTINDKITDYDQLKNIVIEHLAFNNINGFVIDELERQGLDNKVKPSLYEFINSFESLMDNQAGFREKAITASMTKIIFTDYKDGLLKICNRTSYYYIDLEATQITV